jgi:hypothetical protein
MRNLLVFYLFIFPPIIPCIIYIFDYDFRLNFPPNALVYYLLIYCFIYHPIISGLRLMALGKISGSKFLYNFIPAWNTRYFRALFSQIN